jgi:site-specific DNA-methyltransferase (adenine-specific)
MVSPYYSDEWVTLYHGDCRDITDWLTADVLVTDPPYGIRAESKKGTFRGVAGEQTRRAAPIAGDESTELRDAVLARWGGKPRIVFGSWKMSRPDPVDHRLIWHKQGSVFGITHSAFISQDEEIYVTGDGFVRSSPPMRSVIATSEPRQGANGQAAKFGHPTPKPIRLMELLLGRCQSGWLVADPFAGSGSTLVAARNLGRRAIGVEIKERYCEMAARRLSQDVLTFPAEVAG